MLSPRNAIEPIPAGRVQIRELGAGDEEAFFRLASDSRVVENVCWGPYDLEGTRAYLAQSAVNADAVPRTHYDLGIKDVSTGELVGACTIKRRRDDAGWEIGYSLQPGSWGLGLGSETVAALVAFAREHLSARRTVAEVFLENPASMRILEKLGFSGVRRTDRYIAARGRHRRVLLMELRTGNENGRD